MDKETKILLGLGAVSLAIIGYFIYNNKNKDKKCVLKKGLKWGSEYDKDIDDIYYHQNFQDLRSGLFYTRGIETKNPYKDDVSYWYRRYDNKDVADASWCRNDFLADGTLDPNCIINIRELEDLYISGAVC
jgi:hypothetical protein